jgi:hypothetical protein
MTLFTNKLGRVEIPNFRKQGIVEIAASCTKGKFNSSGKFLLRDSPKVNQILHFR